MIPRPRALRVLKSVLNDSEEQVFGKRIEQITFDDVVSFLKEMHCEGPHLDYKAQEIDAKKIATLASAFANTDGGFIIFGVNEADELPVPPFEGNVLNPDIVQQIKHACRNLVPPVEPIVGPRLHNPSDSNKSFLVVAIPQSGRAPHVFKGKDSQYMYVKAADHKEPVQPTLETYRLLARNRSIALKIRKNVSFEHDCQLTKYQRRLAEWTSEHPTSSEVVELNIFRAYPDGKDLVSPQEVIERFDQYKTNVWAEEFKNAYLPTYDSAMDTFERGVLWHSILNNAGFDFTFDCRGFLTFRAAILHNRMNGKNGEPIAWTVPEATCAAMYGMLKMGFKLFEACGCLSALEVRCRIRGGRLADPTYGTRYILRPTWRRAMQHDNPVPEMNYLLGPATFPVQVNDTMPWCDSGCCSEYALTVARRYVSSFNVGESSIVETVSKGMIEAVDGR